MEDSGALPIEMDVSKLKMGDVIEVYPYEGVTKAHGTGETLCTFSLKTDVLFHTERSYRRSHGDRRLIADPFCQHHCLGERGFAVSRDVRHQPKITSMLS